MSLFGKIVLAVLIVGGIGFGVWSQSQKATIPLDTAQYDQASPTLTTGSTNEDLDKDIASIDAQLNLINSSSADIDQSMIDTANIQ